MAKFHGWVGFVESIETSPDVWTDHIIERLYSGDMIQNYPHWKLAQQVNDDLSVNNRISIIADAYALSNFGIIRYVTLHNIKWKVTGVSIQYPRLILDIGDIYNGGEKCNGQST